MTRTWIDPVRFEVGVVVVGQTIGARCVDIEDHGSLLERCIGRLKQSSEFLREEDDAGSTHRQHIRSTLPDTGRGC